MAAIWARVAAPLGSSFPPLPVMNSLATAQFMLSLAQGRTPSHLLGKMTAYIMTLTMCAQPVGQALYGVLFDRFAGSLYLPLIATALIAAAIGLASRGLFARLEQ